MKIQNRWMLKCAGYLTARVSQALVASLDFKAISCDPTTDPLHPRCIRRYLYVTWHECIVVGLPLRSHCGMLGIASEHRDGELLNRAAEILGWEMVRGSTSHSAVSALKQLVSENQLHLNVAPDGPRGPRRTLTQGAIYLASRTGLPLVCCAYGFERPWRLNSWDRCVIPRPFSKARAIFSPPLSIPQRLNRVELEHYRSVVEQLMNQLSSEAEHWAESNIKMPFEFSIRARAMPKAVSDFPERFQTPLSPRAKSLVSLLEKQESPTVSRRSA